MSTKANGTDAKDIALHFVNLTVGRATPAIMKKTIMQAKTMLSSNYTKEEIIQVIDYVVEKKGVELHSLGYISTCINDVLNEIKKQKIKEEEDAKKEQLKKQIASAQEKQRNEVRCDNESTERNRNKANRLGAESRFGKKYNFDLFEGDR